MARPLSAPPLSPRWRDWARRRQRRSSRRSTTPSLRYGQRRRRRFWMAARPGQMVSPSISRPRMAGGGRRGWRSSRTGHRGGGGRHCSPKRARALPRSRSSRRRGPHWASRMAPPGRSSGAMWMTPLRGGWRGGRSASSSPTATARPGLSVKGSHPRSHWYALMRRRPSKRYALRRWRGRWRACMPRARRRSLPPLLPRWMCSRRARATGGTLLSRRRRAKSRICLPHPAQRTI